MLTLVVLAAGLGSRYGGPKQLAPVGPGGETLMDFSVFDAARSGFKRVVLVVRPGVAQQAERGVLSRYRSRLDAQLALQRDDDLPSGVAPGGSRARPWGTTHAVLAARDQISGPFAVLNADDYYGWDAIRQLGGWLTDLVDQTGRGAVVGYPAGETLSHAGGVSRAILLPGPDGFLRRIVETRQLRLGEDGQVIGETAGEAMGFRADTPVSMNLWGFTQEVVTHLADGFRRFVERERSDRAEYYLPEAVQELIAADQLRVSLLQTSSRWSGITYPDDLLAVRSRMAALVAAGEYPDKLWT